MRGILQKFRESLVDGAKVVLDNTFCTETDRRPFVEAADAVGVKIECRWMATSPEDAQLNALSRMWDRYGQVFLDADAIKAKSQTLSAATMKLGEAMYNATQAAEGEGDATSEAAAEEGVVDAEFEEVDGDEKKSA